MSIDLRSTTPQMIFRAMGLIERAFAYSRGRGYGATSVDQEIKLAFRMAKATPRLAIDIGGNVGKYTAGLRARAQDLEIHVFEPSATNIAKLRERFGEDPKVALVESGLADRSGSATLFSNAPGSSLGSLTKRNLDHFDIAFECKEMIHTMRFEDYWTTVLSGRQLDIVKIDVEGHELAVLGGFGQALSATRVLQFEFGGCNIDTRTYFRDFWYFFAERDFDLYRVTPIGAEKIGRYRESEEVFTVTNYIALNRAMH